MRTFKASDLQQLGPYANWGHTNWPESLRTFASFAHTAKMPIGIIYNAAPPNKTVTNQEWLNDAQRNFTYTERTLGIVPHWAVFASWVRFPGRAVTDRAQGKITSLSNICACMESNRCVL